MDWLFYQFVRVAAFIGIPIHIFPKDNWLEEKKKEVAEKMTAVLSITAKAKKREKKGDQHKEKQKKEWEEKEKEEEKKKKEQELEKKKEEASFDTLSNPARVMKAQLKVVRMSDGPRYAPTKDLGIGGIILMRDTKPETPVELVQPVPAMGPKAEEETEPEPPEPFRYIVEED